MKPLTLVYWSRVGLGIAAALICFLIRLDSFLSGLSLAILFYILTYYILKKLFVAKVEKTAELFKMGIGAYFLSWIVAWSLFFTLMVPTAVFTHSPESPVAGQTITFDATGSHDLTGHIVSYTWNFGDENTNTTTKSSITHVYTMSGNYTVTLTVTDNEGYKATRSKNLEIKEID